MAQIIKGAEIAARLCEETAREIKLKNLSPGLAVVLVGDDLASSLYVRNKEQACAKTGIASFPYYLPATVSQDELLRRIGELNEAPHIHGILVQLPLPGHIDRQAVIEAIDPAKDVDGFHPLNAGLLSVGRPGLVPCTPQGVILMLRETGIELTGKKALVIGRSNIVGIPVGHLLQRENCTVVTAHSHTVDLARECRDADIVVAAIGKPEFVKGDWIKEGAVVIDVGINAVPHPTEPNKPKVTGDVDFAAAAERAAFISPVPRGVGPMTIACLMKNTVAAAEAIRSEASLRPKPSSEVLSQG